MMLATPRPTLCLFEPDIPQNTGTILRLGACLGLAVEVIEPCGFVLSEQTLKRSGMDYLDRAALIRHAGWDAFMNSLGQRRLVLLTTAASTPYTAHRFAPDDAILFGRESAGVPDAVHQAAHARLVVPMAPRTRSLNVAVTAAMVAGEALRQLDGFPSP